MRGALFLGGLVGVGIPLYDQIALQINETSETRSLPFIWTGSLANAVSETWLALIGAILILLAIFLPL